MQVSRLSELGGVSVEGVDLTALAPGEGEELGRLYDEHGLVAFRGQSLTKRQLMAACAPFGGAQAKQAAVAADPDPEASGVSVLSTRGYNGQIVPDDPDQMIGYADWHTDQGYVTAPNRGKIIYAVQIPEEGGRTGFIDGQLTYRALPEGLRRRIEALHVVQSWGRIHRQLEKSRHYQRDGATELASDRFPDIAYPLVYPHPVTGEKVLNVPPMWADGVAELPGEEGKALVAELVGHATKPTFQYWHQYQPGDAVIWDNWRFLHAAEGAKGRYVRTMWTVAINAGPELGRSLAA